MHRTPHGVPGCFGSRILTQISLSPEAKQRPSSIASEACSANVYMVQIAGYASRTGSAELDEELSNERADAVIGYLTQSGHIPMYRILPPAAMGASSTAGTDAALDRRVVVKVVVNEVSRNRRRDL